jgi:hypothetical protein
MRGDAPRTHRIKLRDASGHVTGEREVVSFRGLLEMVHRERLRETTTELIQAPTKDNGETAIVRATVRTAKGTFSGIGDANPRNVAPHIAPHIIRMAETRALARALRVATGCGETALEELDGSYDETSSPDQGRGHSEPRQHHAPVADAPRAARHHSPPRASNGSRGGRTQQTGPVTPASENQRRFLYRLLEQLGKTGEEAHRFIHEALGVDSLDDAPKHSVSVFIDTLKSQLDRGGFPATSERSNGRANGATNGHHGHNEPGMRG